MSNLYKAQVNTNKGDVYTRVIDYNELLEQKLSAISFERQAALQRQQLEERKRQMQNAGASGQGDGANANGGASGGENADADASGQGGVQAAEFSEGLFGMGLSVSPEMEIDYVERAKEQADKIVAKATADAETLLKKAAQEAENLKQRIKEEAAQQGYDEGMRKAQSKETQMRAQMAQRQEQQQQEYEERLRQMEPQLMDAVIRVFDEVLHTDFADHRAVLLHLIRRTVQNIKNSRVFRIFVSADDYPEISGQKERLIEKIGGEAVLDIIMDEAMQPGQCTIDTDEGIFECGLDIQLENLTKDLKALACINLG